MKKLEDIIVEFSSLHRDKKEDYLNALQNEELKLILPNFRFSSYYTELIEDILRKRLGEEREEKINKILK